MPRTARASAGGVCYHVLNRGNGRAEVFHKEGDYAAFVDLLAAANERLPMRILGYVLMPNHFHLVLWPHAAGDLSRWMQWLLTSHVRRYHRHYHSSGHVWQGRFKAFPVEQDEHLIAVLRYVERNPLRASLVERAEDWHWSSLAWRTKGKRPAMLAKWPVRCPRNWIDYVNAPQTEAEALPRYSLRRRALESTRRQTPGPRILTPATQSAKKTEKVECPLLLSFTFLSFLQSRSELFSESQQIVLTFFCSNKEGNHMSAFCSSSSIP